MAAYAAPQARVRARYSRLLDAEQWRRLLAATDVAALYEQLRASTWGDNDLPETAADLERMLAARVAAETKSLARGLPTGARQLVEWYGRRFELDNLKSLLRALTHGSTGEQLGAVLVPLSAPTLPWQALREAGSLAAFIERLRGTPFATPLELAQERYQQERLPFYLEVALDLAYFQRLVRLLRRLPAADRTQAERFLGRWVDLQNLLWAFRYRLYAAMKPEEIMNFTLHRAFSVGVDTVRRIAQGSSVLQETARLGLTIPEDTPDAEALPLLERLAARELHTLAKAAFTRPLFDLGGVLAYLLLLESETMDLITLIEGKSLGMSADELRPQLVREV